jgi:hypothetical protein
MVVLGPPGELGQRNTSRFVLFTVDWAGFMNDKLKFAAL